jgi:hypothetical protein
LSVLEANRREPDDDARGGDGQTFHAGVSRERELQHDADLFRAYLDRATTHSRRCTLAVGAVARGRRLVPSASGMA